MSAAEPSGGGGMPQEIDGEGSEILPLCRNRVARVLFRSGKPDRAQSECQP